MANDDPEDGVRGDSLVEAPSLRSQIYTRLRDDIISGRIAPGARISPAETARRFGVSPMPVRDAFGRLEEEGLVEVAARRWTRVVELSPELVDELVPLVSLLEQYAISSAALVSDEALARLRDANAALAVAIENGDVTASIEADSTFHDTLVELAGNRSLERALIDARTRIRLLRPQVLRLEGAVKSVADHEQIIERLERGDRKGAARALDKNWRRGLARFRSTRP
jgi:DNA-binding GntR family transcriptional regulator